MLPSADAEHVKLVAGLEAYAFGGLTEVCAHLRGIVSQPSLHTGASAYGVNHTSRDLAEVHGQSFAKRALTIAAAGGHSVLMVGPPGVGKTMLATRFPGLLSNLDESQAVEVARIWSAHQGGFDPQNWRNRPFRNPHHSASSAALVGGGAIPKPGEVSLAHHGVLFLDELPEFSRQVLECLREPIETGQVNISRAAGQMTFPSRFQLLAAMNPCPCGYLGDGTDRCQCTPDRIRSYRHRISGPLLDRLDMHIQLEAVTPERLHRPASRQGETGKLAQQVSCAKNIQTERQGIANADLEGEQLDQYCALDEATRKLLVQASSRLRLSSRASVRIRKLARTIADLDQRHQISAQHLSEAINYRVLDRPVSVSG